MATPSFDVRELSNTVGLCFRASVHCYVSFATSSTQLSNLFVFPLWQGLFGKSLDSPAAADADASDTQSVDSGLSRPDSSNSKRDTVCHVSLCSSPYPEVCQGFGAVLSSKPCLCVSHRSVRSMERAWWCVMATAIGSSTWSVLA